MLLKEWQIRNQSPRKNDRTQSDYYVGSNYYWNLHWDVQRLKYLIPYQSHPFAGAQVRHCCF